MYFTRVQGTGFVRGEGQPLYLSGTNCYYLPFRPALRNGVLDAAQAMGLNVIRTMGFHTTLEQIEELVAAARQHEIQLILTLTNNWKDYGGIPEYVANAGLTKHDDFFTEERIKQAYRAYVTQVVERFKDEPVIMAWELINEPRSEGGVGKALSAWVDEMSRFVKTLDPNHLIAVGDEGFLHHHFSFDWMHNGSTGVDAAKLLKLDAIDFGTYHLYPDGPWGKTAKWASESIEEHQELAEKTGKPVLLEEFGWTGKPERNEVYAQWMETLDKAGACGNLFWMLAGPQEDGTPYPDDKYTIYDAAEIPSVVNHARAKVNG